MVPHSSGEPGDARTDARLRVAVALVGVVRTGVRQAPRGMSLTSASTLATLERTGPRRLTDLAAVEGVTQPGMTVLVRTLEEAGLVARQGDPTDKRVALIELTTTGLEFLQARRREGAEGFAQLIDKLPATEIAALIAALPALERLRDFDDEHRDPPLPFVGEQFSSAPRDSPEPAIRT
jgi:DNA-binding MarR family transcriptional regulator